VGLRPLSPDQVGIGFGDVGNVGEVLATRLLERRGAEVAHIHLLSHDPAPLMSYLTSHQPPATSPAGSREPLP
jgi:hypothetical protein